MRFVDYEEIFEQMAAGLQSKVLPNLSDVEARQQTWAAIGLLDNIASRMRDQDTRLEREVETLTGLIADAPEGVITDDHAAPDAELPTRQYRRALADCLAQALTDLAGRDATGSEDEAERGSELEAWLERCGVLLLEMETREMERMRPTRYYQSMRG